MMIIDGVVETVITGDHKRTDIVFYSDTSRKFEILMELDTQQMHLSWLPTKALLLQPRDK
jgi:hypothetical protein